LTNAKTAIVVSMAIHEVFFVSMVTLSVSPMANLLVPMLRNAGAALDPTTLRPVHRCQALQEEKKSKRSVVAHQGQ
jgi:hypothetical protein